MGKFIILGLIIWLILHVIKRYHLNKTQRAQTESQAPSENMVQCAHCGVHLPVSEAILTQSRYYCCVAHTPN